MDCPGEEEGVRSWLPQLYSELGERLKEHKAWVEQVVTCDSGNAPGSLACKKTRSTVANV